MADWASRAQLKVTFDGDQMSLYIAMDKKIAAMLQSLVPSYSIGGNNSPRSLSDQMQLPRPVMVTVGNWYGAGGKEQPTPEQIAYTNALAAA